MLSVTESRSARYVQCMLQGTPRAWAEGHIMMRLWKAARGLTKIHEAPLEILVDLIQMRTLSALDKLGALVDKALHQLCSASTVESRSITLDMVWVLLEAGADPARATNDGMTPFHSAIHTLTVNETNMDIVRCLLEISATHAHAHDDVDNTPDILLDYDGTINTLLGEAWGPEARKADSRGKTLVEKNADKIKDQVLAREIRRLLAI
ncbi:hypothetical protein BJX64DRAFT_293194 [Aspergillus heterothallicus]